MVERPTRSPVAPTLDLADDLLTLAAEARAQSLAALAAGQTVLATLYADSAAYFERMAQSNGRRR